MMANEKSHDSLWTLIAGPTVWAAYFLLCYIVAAIYCAKTPSPDVSLNGVRIGLAALTAIALALIVQAGLRAYRQWGFGDEPPPHDEDTLEDRRRFLGYATLLLCGLSFVATVYVALPVLMISTCR